MILSKKNHHPLSHDTDIFLHKWCWGEKKGMQNEPLKKGSMREEINRPCLSSEQHPLITTIKRCAYVSCRLPLKWASQRMGSQWMCWRRLIRGSAACARCNSDQNMATWAKREQTKTQWPHVRLPCESKENTTFTWAVCWKEGSFVRNKCRS